MIARSIGEELDVRVGVVLLQTKDSRHGSRIQPTPTFVTVDVVECDFFRFCPNLSTKLLTDFRLAIAEKPSPIAVPEVMEWKCTATSAKVCKLEESETIDRDKVSTSSVLFSSERTAVFVLLIADSADAPALSKGVTLHCGATFALEFCFRAHL